jgi:SAM-dependent methyltransferase
MDAATLAAYDSNASAYAAEWLSQDAPEDMYALLRAHFDPGPTADVGCGAGRDTAWLAANGFDARGFDASAGLLAQARAAHPALRFDAATLPELAGVERGAFQNVLCETVIMHLPPALVGPSVRSLLALLRPGGTLYLSWRVTDDTDKRDPAGRLYAAFDEAIVTDALAPGDAILHDEDRTSVSSGKRVRRLVVRRGTQAATRRSVDA